MADSHVTFTFAEVKENYLKVVNQGASSVVKRTGNATVLQHLKEGWSRQSSFYGPSSKTVIEWLHKGYHQPGLTLDPPILPVRKKRRLVFGEEGEYQHDLMLSGFDYPFLEWTKRDIMPGMRVNIRACFQAGTQVEVIQEYYRWILRALVALESAGIDLEVWMSDESKNVFTNSNDNQFMHVQVKKEGEQTDLLSWSPMISPAGYRHLMFMCQVIAGDVKGYNVSNGLGHGFNDRQPWAVKFDVQKRELGFYCPWHPYEFPEAEMEMQLREVLKQARRAA